MKTRQIIHVVTPLAVAAFAMTACGQAVDVTATLDASSIAAGGTTTLRVYARVATVLQTNANRIFSWYVDVLNTNGSVATANYGAMLKTASDKDPQTSSTGTPDGANRRAVYDTFLNLPGAGVAAPVELMAIPVSGLTLGRTRFSVQAGTGVGLSADFLVAPLTDDPPFVGGSYGAAQVILTVTQAAPMVALSISATNAGAGLKGVTLRFTPAAGFNHTAQYRDQLNGGVGWQPLPGAPHNSGAVFDLSAASKRFYRVLLTSVN